MNKTLKSYRKHIRYLEKSFEEQEDYNVICVYFLSTLALDDDFIALCAPLEDLTLRHFITVMAQRNDPGTELALSKITMYRAPELGFVFGSAQSADKKINVVYFLLEEKGKGLLSCTNFNNHLMTCGEFTINTKVENNPTFTRPDELNLN